MKRFLTVLVVLLIAILSISVVFASGDEKIEETTTNKTETTTTKIEISDEVGNASSTTINNLTEKDKKIEEYTKALKGNKTNGTVLYYLELARVYSYPVIFVLMVIAALNYFIIGNKKLDKRESGFRMLVTLVIGLIVFQILPLLFAIIVS